MAVNMMPINPSVMLLDPQSSSGSARRNSNTESTSQGTQRASVNQDALIAENPLSRLSDNFEDSTRIAEDPAMAPALEPGVLDTNLRLLQLLETSLLWLWLTMKMAWRRRGQLTLLPPRWQCKARERG